MDEMVERGADAVDAIARGRDVSGMLARRLARNASDELEIKLARITADRTLELLACDMPLVQLGALRLLAEMLGLAGGRSRNREKMGSRRAAPLVRFRVVGGSAVAVETNGGEAGTPPPPLLSEPPK